MAGRRTEYELIMRLSAALGSNFNRSFQSAMRVTNQLQSVLSDMRRTQQDVSGYETQLQALNANQQKLEELQEEYQRLQEEEREAGEVSEELAERYARNQRELSETTSAIERQTEELDELRERLQDAGVDTDNLSEENDRLRGSYENLRRSQERFSEANAALDANAAALSETRTELLKTVGAAAGAGAAFYAGAIKPAMEFESAFAGVKKTIDGTPDQLLSIQQGIRDMAMEIPLGTTEIAAIAEAAGQLGIQTDNVIGFTRVMADLGVTTNLQGEEAASTLAKFANITGMAQDDFDRLGSTIVALGNNLATTESDIAAMGLRLAGAGSQIGLTDAQVLSFAGALSSVGIEAEAGGSAFSKVMVEMQLAVETGNESLSDFAKVAGMSSADFKKAFKEDAAGAINEFIKGLSESGEQGTSAIKVLDDMGITETRMRDALLRASGANDVFVASLELGTQAWEENTALADEARQRYETTESNMIMMKNAFNDTAISLGTIFLPKLAEVATNISETAARVSKYVQENKEMVVMVTKVIATLLGAKIAFLAIKTVVLSVKQVILGVKVAMAAYRLVQAAAAAGTSVWAIVSATASVSTGAFAGAMLALAGPILGIVAAVAAVIAIVILLVKNWDKVKETAGIVWNSIKEAFAGVPQFFSSIFSKAWQAVKSVFSSVGAFFKELWGSIVEVFTTIGTVVGDAIGNAFKTVVNTVIGFAEGFINNFLRGINLAINAINAIPGVNIELLPMINIPRLEKGSNYTPDTFIAGDVGGKGGELITGARGRKVFTAAQTGAIFENINRAMDIMAASTAPTLQAPTVISSGSGTQGFVIQYSPTIYVDGNKPEDMEEQLRQNNESLLQMFKEFLRQQKENERRWQYA